MKKVSLIVVMIALILGVSYKVVTTSKNQNLSKGTDVPGSAVVGAGTAGTTPENSVGGAPGTGTTGAGTVGGVATTGSGSGGTAADAAAKAKANELTAVKVEHNCFSFEYKHKKDAANRDIEDFLELSNAFPVMHSNWNKNTMCVKVNQKPVAYKLIKNKNAEEVLIGSVVGPESVIRVSYCTGKAVCKESCATPKKRFMDDVEEEAGTDDAFQDSWGNTGEENKKELKAKAKELRSVASENENLDTRSIVREWDTLNQNEWTCKEK